MIVKSCPQATSMSSNLIGNFPNLSQNGLRLSAAARQASPSAAATPNNHGAQQTVPGSDDPCDGGPVSIHCFGPTIEQQGGQQPGGAQLLVAAGVAGGEREGLVIFTISKVPQ